MYCQMLWPIKTRQIESAYRQAMIFPSSPPWKLDGILRQQRHSQPETSAPKLRTSRRPARGPKTNQNKGEYENCPACHPTP